MSLDLVLLLMMNGLVSGSLYGLVAMGFVLIYKTSGVLNFAQGELVLAGGLMAAYFINQVGLPFVIGAILALGVAVLWGMLIERFVVGPLAGSEAISIMMATIAIGLVVRNVTLMLAGADTHGLPGVLPTTPVTLLGFALSPLQIVIAILAVVLAVSLGILFKATRLGISMQAVANDPPAAAGMGIPIKRVIGWSWILSALVAAIGGIALGSLLGVSPQLSFVGLKVFPAVILGGLDSLKGAIVGGLAVGLIENLAGPILNPFVILLIVLMIRPTGLFGTPAVRRV